MKILKRSVQTTQLSLSSDGGRLLQLLGTETRRFMLLFKRRKKSLAFVPRQADGAAVTRGYMETGTFKPPHNADGKHRCVATERPLGVAVTCNCGWHHFEPFNFNSDRSYALRHALNQHVAHADGIHAALKAVE